MTKPDPDPRRWLDADTWLRHHALQADPPTQREKRLATMSATATARASASARGRRGSKDTGGPDPAPRPWVGWD